VTNSVTTNQSGGPSVGTTVPLTVTCPTGDVATGGGGQVQNATASENVSLTSSGPQTNGVMSAAGQTPNGWQAQAEQEAGPTNAAQWTFEVWAICTP